MPCGLIGMLARRQGQGPAGRLYKLLEELSAEEAVHQALLHQQSGRRYLRYLFCRVGGCHVGVKGCRPEARMASGPVGRCTGFLVVSPPRPQS